MVLPSHSQNILKEPRVQTVINQKGDTLIQLKLSDAKLILAEVLDKEVADSLVNVYMLRDSLNKTTIELQVKEIKALQQKGFNYNQQVANLEKIVGNKDEELEKLNEIIKFQKKEIRKQKTYKILGFTAAVVLPILVLFVAH